MPRAVYEAEGWHIMALSTFSALQCHFNNIKENKSVTEPRAVGQTLGRISDSQVHGLYWDKVCFFIHSSYPLIQS